jgi:hypothetical protein
MGNDGAPRRILDRSSKSYIQIILRGDRNGNVRSVPSHCGKYRLNVGRQGLCHLVDGVRSEIAYRLPNWIPRIVGRGF